MLELFSRNLVLSPCIWFKDALIYRAYERRWPPAKMIQRRAPTLFKKDEAMKNIARTAPIRHYASYVIGGVEVEGIATLVCGSGYLFQKTDAHQAVLVSYKDQNLLLYGRCDLADAQYALDQAHGLH